MPRPLFPSALVLLLAAASAASAQGACQAPAALQFADEGGPHMAECSALSPSHYPPTSGPHYPVWANPGTYKSVVNAGYWLHSMEHGSVVFLVNCHLAPDCLADFDRFQAIADAFPTDPACENGEKRRIVITGDTTITTRYAAAAWNWSLSSDCLDSAAFAAFLNAHYAKTFEDFCGGGTDFSGTGRCNAPLALELPQARTPAPARSRGGSAGRPTALWPGLPEYLRPDGRNSAPR
jgi:Protein of unknown function (DUF3105)